MLNDMFMDLKTDRSASQFYGLSPAVLNTGQLSCQELLTLASTYGDSHYPIPTFAEAQSSQGF